MIPEYLDIVDGPESDLLVWLSSVYVYKYARGWLILNFLRNRCITTSPSPIFLYWASDFSI